MTYSDELHIDYIIDHFNFKKVKKHMDSANWTWGFNNNVPSIFELKSSALNLLMNAVDEESGYWVESGGFCVMKCGDYLKLNFSVAESSSEILNFNDNYKMDRQKSERKEKLEIIDGIST